MNFALSWSYSRPKRPKINTYSPQVLLPILKGLEQIDWRHLQLRHVLAPLEASRLLERQKSRSERHRPSGFMSKVRLCLRPFSVPSERFGEPSPRSYLPLPFTAIIATPPIPLHSSNLSLAFLLVFPSLLEKRFHSITALSPNCSDLRAHSLRSIRSYRHNHQQIWCTLYNGKAGRRHTP
ncbi:hypothetical protein BU26DRAFT_5137 [Trematosphaeria pertusa]|uniref:Uncharacterized protein n=1 Tax=Trematosphaeria pertusa TaxID=390896 RepID=A0A6A6J0H7_9PLEO|nr:uncharacterized protein BU26DRAFT_5137 [Trematosphaeria pertusa]KAF2255652.1 hypothetical protein BU26DRAFT_5137 [Trematosphaeria pertusa]